MTVNLLKKEKSSKTGLRGKSFKASWNNDYNLELISLV